MKFFEGWDQFDDLAALLALMAVAGGIYGAIVLASFGRDWLRMFRGAGPR
jgi:hypothetical protein